MRVTFAMQRSGPEGMGTSEENETLYAIEDALFAKLCRELRAKYVGRITSDGWRKGFYYARTPAGLEEAARDAMAAFPDYRIEVRTEADPQWRVYLDQLAPDEFGRHTIENRRLVDMLKQSGDDGESPRPVDHWLYFESAEGRQKFVEQVRAEGFAAQVLDETAQSDPQRPYGVQLTRHDRATLEWLDPLTADLWFRAENCGGRYDGWGAMVTSGGS